MRLEYFYYIAEVNKCHSISRAAKNLYVTQPTISIAIQSMEDELGIKIFERSNKGVVLTKDGEKLYKKIVTIIDEVGSIEEMFQKREYNEISIGAVPEVCNSFMMDLVEKYQNSGDKIALDIHEQRTNEMVTNLIAGKNDVGIGCYTLANKEKIIGLLNSHNIVVEPIIEDSMSVFISNKDKRAITTSISTKDLKDKTAIIFDDSEPILGNGDVNKSVSVKKHLSFTDKTSIKNAIARDLGYAILPSIMAINDLYVQTGIIKVIPLINNNIQITTFIAYQKRRGAKDLDRVISDIKKLASEMQKKINVLDSKEEGIENNYTQIYY